MKSSKQQPRASENNSRETCRAVGLRRAQSSRLAEAEGAKGTKKEEAFCSVQNGGNLKYPFRALLRS